MAVDGAMDESHLIIHSLYSVSRHSYNPYQFAALQFLSPRRNHLTTFAVCNFLMKGAYCLFRSSLFSLILTSTFFFSLRRFHGDLLKEQQRAFHARLPGMLV